MSSPFTGASCRPPQRRRMSSEKRLALLGREHEPLQVLSRALAPGRVGRSRGGRLGELHGALAAGSGARGSIGLHEPLGHDLKQLREDKA